MSLDSKMGSRLSLYRTLGTAIEVELESGNSGTFIAKVEAFITHGIEDTKVVFGRVEQTVFPTDTVSDQPDTFVCYIRDVKEIKAV